MDDGGLVAGRSIQDSQPGSIIGGVVVGATVLACSLLVGSPATADIIATVAQTAFFAVVWGVAMGLYVRRQWRRLAPPLVTHHVERPRLSGVARGVLDAALVAAAATAASGVALWLIGETGDSAGSRAVLGILPGGLFGLSICTAISAGELRRWQDQHGLRLHRRVGGTRVAWTRAQALQRLVAVPMIPAPR